MKLVRLSPAEESSASSLASTAGPLFGLSLVIGSETDRLEECRATGALASLTQLGPGNQQADHRHWGHRFPAPHGEPVL